MTNTPEDMKKEDGGAAFTDDDNEYDFVTCPKCHGTGEVDCHCGGDLCVCDNHGEATCPLCAGDAEIPSTDYDAWIKRSREQQKVFADALLKSRSE